MTREFSEAEDIEDRRCQEPNDLSQRAWPVPAIRAYEAFSENAARLSQAHVERLREEGGELETTGEILHEALDQYTETYARVLTALATMQEAIAAGEIESDEVDSPGFEINLVAGGIYTLLDDMAVAICDLKVMMKEHAGESLDWSEFEE